MTARFSREQTVVTVSPTDPPDPSDAQLWRLIAGDDHDAFTTLYERHAEAVWNYAYRLTASWSAADDLLSAVFLTAWRRRGTVHLVRESALPWLYTVASNVCRTERRRVLRFLRMSSRLLVPGDHPDHAERTAEEHAAQQRLRQVLTAIGHLSPGERAAVELCLLGGTSTRDAAELLGISEATLRARVSRARAKLRREVGDQDDV